MQFNNLQRKTKRKVSAQVGRGGKRGKTSGRGTKGQKARAGHKIRPEIRDLIKHLPKLRGRGTNFLKSISAKPFAVNLSALEKSFAAGETVTLASLREKGVAPKGTSVKILGTGEISKKITVEGCAVSASAKEKIEKVGGSIK
jgi:large subunit ribosomal protein L15